jgi:hypothetical protein
MMVFLERGAPSRSSSRTEGAVRATMASISAEPERGEVRLLLEELPCCAACGPDRVLSSAAR